MWHSLHAELLCEAFEKVLGPAEQGTVAFVRCLASDITEQLARDPRFEPSGWHVWRVADIEDSRHRTLTADRAVELREEKGQAALLLVDVARAGAGMDGVYSAAREIDESTLFGEACRLAENKITERLSRSARERAKRAVRKARAPAQRAAVSPWAEFDYLVRIAAEGRAPGELLYLLGLWPVRDEAEGEAEDSLRTSRLFVERLLEVTASPQTPAQRIQSLKLAGATERQRAELERFLFGAAGKPLLSALSELADKPDLWVNALRIEGGAATLEAIELVPWRTRTGKVAKWSGLAEPGHPADPLALVLDPEAEQTGRYASLEIRWKSCPADLQRGAVQYHVAVVSDMEEELACRDVAHSGRKEEKCRFSDADFAMLDRDALVHAKVVVSAIGSKVESQETEEFVIRFGEPAAAAPTAIARGVRTLSEGLIELDSRDKVTEATSCPENFHLDPRGFVVCRTSERKSYRVFYPSLIREVESAWVERGQEIGRWQVKVRASGEQAGPATFVRFEPPQSAPEGVQHLWDRVSTASRRMASEFRRPGGGIAQVYDEKSKTFENVVKEYLLAWAALLEDEAAEPGWALAHTVEVQSLSGRTAGLIVLPSHPLRMAWHVAYDNLVFHAAFEEKRKAKEIAREFAILDGAMFPAFLPGLARGQSFVFADTLGFHAAGMVPDTDKEPKAAVALLARALDKGQDAEAAPTVGVKSTEVVAQEILKYLQCHDKLGSVLHLHALRPGDGLTVARALGCVYQRSHPAEDGDSAGQDSDEGDSPETRPRPIPAFVLELYPSREQRGVAGRFLSEAREKRRSAAGLLPAGDLWMLESISLPGGVSLPRLRWARKESENPQKPAHLAIAFDTFASSVIPEDLGAATARPLYAYGLISFFERQYRGSPSPLWHGVIPQSSEGQKHPSDRSHTERLVRLQQAVYRCTARNLRPDAVRPALRTEISPEKADSLRTIHRLCDWVITLDRNAGVEYFDSPRDHRDVYDAYVIDCVPEREDLGCLQLITSTASLDEVRNLLDDALDQMGLSHSRRNAEFLLEHLKALSGRLAIRLTGQTAASSELIALAISYANCLHAREDSTGWLPLSTGFFVPVDDVRDLIPPLTDQKNGTGPTASRPDLIYVSLHPRRGLAFRFIEVKYRRHLRAARNPELLEGIRQQIQALRERWDQWYSGSDNCPTFQAVRKAKLARVLRFYADKARRHADDERKLGISAKMHEDFLAEIDRMVEKGYEYAFAPVRRGDRGWVFCPEYAGAEPLDIAPPDWDTRIFLLGPGALPDGILPPREELCPAGPAESESGSLPRAPSQVPETKSLSADLPLPQPTPARTGRPETPAAGEHAAAGDGQPPAILLGTDCRTEEELRWTLTLRGNPHLLVAGLPGMGKTTCLLNLCTQMLQARICPIIFSYHQDIDTGLRESVHSVRFIDVRGLGFNPLQILDRQTRKAYLDVAGAVRDIFLAIFPDLGDIQGEALRKAIKESFVELGWDDPGADPAQLREPEFHRFVQILRDTPKPDRGLRTLLARLGELEDYGFFEPAETQASLWDSRDPIVIRIHGSQNDNLQKAFASLVFYGLYKDMFRRGIQDRITHAVVFDEAHRAAKLKLIPTMAKECRKYGLSLILASQEAKDFHTSLFSAIANYLVLRLTEADARALVRNVARSDQERILIDRIKQMPRFQALYFSEAIQKPALVALAPPCSAREPPSATRTA